MNIVWFTWKDRQNPLAGGAEVVNEELAARLVRNGHRVTFLVAGYPGAPSTTTRRGFGLVRVGSRFTSYLAAWAHYREHRDELAADLVIDECNTMPFFAGWYSGVPTVLFFHMLCRRIWFYEFPFPLSLVGYLVEPLYLRLLKRAPTITVSRSTAEDLQRQGFRAADQHIIGQGIELTPLPDLRSVAKATRPTILSLGAMRSMKRTLHHVRAFELAKLHVPDLQLHIAGDSSGRYGQRVLKAIMRSRYASDIYYHGRVSAAEKLRLLRTSHVILQTAVKEGWGLTITEAASQGTPAVAYDVDGLRDSIRHGQTGLLTATNPQALAEAIVGLLRDRDRYAQLRRAAWQWSRRFTFDQSYRDFERALGLKSAKR